MASHNFDLVAILQLTAALIGNLLLYWLIPTKLASKCSREAQKRTADLTKLLL